MRRKLVILILVLLGMLLLLFGLFAAWTWYQVRLAQSLQTGNAHVGSALGGLVIPQTAVLYGLLAAGFLLLTIVLIWIIYRLVMFPPDDSWTETTAEE